MVKLETPVCDFGQPAVDFALPGVDGKIWTLRDCLGPNGVLVMFICNHCPYVQAIRERLIQDVTDLRAVGIHTVAIMPNDTTRYPEDDFAAMRETAERYHYPFPYLLDATQAVARAYGALCTPDFFGYNKDLQLQYRGRLDAGHRQATRPDGAPRELYEAMWQIATTGRGPRQQYPSMGCSIKWQTDAAESV